MEKDADRVADELHKFTEAFFPPISKHHNKAERASLAKSADKFAGAAAAILVFIENGKITEIRKQELIDHFFVACFACQQHKDVRLGAIERLENEIKKLPPKREKFTPKIIK